MWSVWTKRGWPWGTMDHMDGLPWMEIDGACKLQISVVQLFVGMALWVYGSTRPVGWSQLEVSRSSPGPGYCSAGLTPLVQVLWDLRDLTRVGLDRLILCGEFERQLTWFYCRATNGRFQSSRNNSSSSSPDEWRPPDMLLTHLPHDIADIPRIR